MIVAHNGGQCYIEKVEAVWTKDFRVKKIFRYILEKEKKLFTLI